MRKELATHLDSPEISTELTQRIQLIQRLFRDFMSEVGSDGDRYYPRHSHIGTDPLSMALGRLRGLVGVQIGEMAAMYNLDVSEELATIVPDQDGWFFELIEELAEDAD